VTSTCQGHRYSPPRRPPTCTRCYSPRSSDEDPSISGFPSHLTQRLHIVFSIFPSHLSLDTFGKKRGQFSHLNLCFPDLLDSLPIGTARFKHGTAQGTTTILNSIAMIEISQTFSSALQATSCQGLQKLSRELWSSVSKNPDQSNKTKITSRAIRACLAPDDALSIPTFIAFLGQLSSTCSDGISLQTVKSILTELCDSCSNSVPCVRIRALSFLQAMLSHLSPNLMDSDLSCDLQAVLAQRLSDKDAKARRMAVLATGSLTHMLQVSLWHSRRSR